ncbi:hypothetical protein C0J52_11767 [Blattella germanica]|nr:hypothetical protein C0J52_11767 [Blattella germanica]
MLQEEGVKKLIHDRDAQFDLVILEPFNECFLGFVHKFKAPLVQVNTFAGMHFMGDWLGNPHPYSYVPDIFLGGSDRMDFIERLLNTISGTIWRIARHYLYLPGQDAVMKKHFGFLEGLPDASDIEYSTSILLLNHHFSIGYPRPLMPSMIQDLQSFMDDAPNGVIYFSLGSNLQSSVMPIPQRDALLKAFSQLKQKVLWKWETDTLPGQPKNVKLGKWLPQADILAHPNLRIFITHGGLLSTQEALNRGVPVIGIPLFADQDENMKKAELSGYGIIVSFRTLTTESISSAIKEVLENPRYANQASLYLFLALLFAANLRETEEAKILAFFPLQGKSHKIFTTSFAKELAKRGHELTVVNPFPEEEKIPNYKVIPLGQTTIQEMLKNAGMAKQAALYLFLALLFAANLRETEEAKILAFFPLQGKSHKIFTTSFAKELAKRGHELTVVNPFPEEEKIPNYKVIPLGQTTIQEMLKNAGLDADKDLNPFDMMNNNYIQSVFMLWGMGTFICDYALAYETMQNLMKSNEKYDLILLEYFYSDCFYGFAHKFKVPVIQMCAFAGTEVLGDLIGNPSPYAYVPDPFTAFTDKMGFTERLLNTVGQLFQKLGTEYYFLPKQDKVMRKHFKDPNMPYIGELQKSTALVLINHHFSLSYPRPMVPNFVQVGGMHVKPPKKLPVDLQKFMDEATDGVVLFSMGSNLKSTDMPKETVQALVQGFGALKQKVLWKWEDDALPGQPKNLKIQKWLPQSDILAHPNLRLFITHGGLLSTQETINRGVPVVGIPIFGDQRLNMAKCESMGFGIKLEYKNITKESIVWAAKEVLDNPNIHLGDRILKLEVCTFEECFENFSILSLVPLKLAHFCYAIARDRFLLVSDLKNWFEEKSGWNFHLISTLWNVGHKLCHMSFQHEFLQNLINNNEEHYDLVVVGSFFYDCLMGLGPKLKIPIVQLASFGGTRWMHEWMGNPSPYSYIPDLFLPYTDRMNFWQRFINTYSELSYKIGRQIYYLPQQNEIMQHYLSDGKNFPTIYDLEKNISLLLVNSHFSISFPRPLTPNVVQVGGLHVKPPKKLPLDLQKYLDDAPHGVIYFSMGSNLRSSNLPEATRDAFLKAFSKLKQKVLWKWETDSLPGQPKNVKLGKWLPQSDVLGKILFLICPKFLRSSFSAKIKHLSSMFNWYVNLFECLNNLNIRMIFNNNRLLY